MSTKNGKEKSEMENKFYDEVYGFLSNGWTEWQIVDYLHQTYEHLERDISFCDIICRAGKRYAKQMGTAYIKHG